MKEFEKWDMQEYPLPPTIERGPCNREMLKQRKHAWKAALEWILYAGVLTDLPKDLIEEELKDE